MRSAWLPASAVRAFTALEKESFSAGDKHIRLESVSVHDGGVRLVGRYGPSGDEQPRPRLR